MIADLLVLFLAARLGGEIAERLRMPAVLGEIAAGVLVGPGALGLLHPEASAVHVLAEFGVVLLVLQVGLESDIGELAAVGRAAMAVAVAGIVLPMVGGIAVALALGLDGTTSVFLGAALTATSVGITARVFGDLRALSRTEARTVLGAAVADDVLGLVVLTVVAGVATKGSIDAGGVLTVVASAVAYLVAGALAVRFAPTFVDRAHGLTRTAGAAIAVVLVVTLALAEVAHVAKLAPIIGAFFAGLLLGRTRLAERARRDAEPLTHALVPAFFVSIGVAVEPAELMTGRTLTVAAALTAVAVVGKVAAGWAAVGSPGDRLLMGLGMLPRGEVGLIFANVGLASGVLGTDLYGAIVLVVLATTVVTPPLLAQRLRSLRSGAGAMPRPAAGAEPAAGWLQRIDGHVELVEEPPDHVRLAIALEAAVLLADGARPAPSLLDGLSASGTSVWDKRARQAFFRLLEDGTARSWRFLEATGVLDDVLPELSATLQHRRTDATELDPTHVFRWATVEAIHEIPGDVPHRDWLALAALVVDVTGGGQEAVATARGLVKRLELGARAEQEIALLVESFPLLVATARRPDGLDEVNVTALAAHIGTPERAVALHCLASVVADLEAWERQRLDALHEAIQAVLADATVNTLAEERRIAATRLLGGAMPGADRLRLAPRAWLVAQSSSELAAQAALIDPVPPGSSVRVQVDDTTLRVACRDRRGLLARVTGGLTALDLSVLEAMTATWPDGGVVMSFVLQREPPAPVVVEASLQRAMNDRLAAAPVPEARVSADNASSPWYTIIDVEAPDRTGLLHAITVAMTAAGADIHTVRARTDCGQAVDRFEVTDGRGDKLGDGHVAAIQRNLVVGRTPRLTLSRAR